METSKYTQLDRQHGDAYDLARRLVDPGSELYHAFRDKVGVLHGDMIDVRTQAIPVGGHRLLLQDETVHGGGSYKVRGFSAAALEAVERNPNLRTIHVATAGNFGLGGIQPCRALGLNLVVHCSRDSSSIKLTKIQDASLNEPREGRSARRPLVQNTYASLPDAIAGSFKAHGGRSETLHPFDQAAVIAGQSTWLRDALDNAVLQGVDLKNDQIVIVSPMGGGGAAAGAELQLEYARQSGEIGHNVTHVTTQVYDPTTNADKSKVAWCDGTATRTGILTDYILSLNPDLVELRVTPTEVSQAMYEASPVAKKLIEPAGALAVAGVKRAVKDDLFNKDTVFIAMLSGANVSQESWATAMDYRDIAYRAVMRDLASRVNNLPVAHTGVISLQTSVARGMHTRT